MWVGYWIFLSILRQDKILRDIILMLKWRQGCALVRADWKWQKSICKIVGHFRSTDFAQMDPSLRWDDVAMGADHQTLRC
jgi:hypothetical protein